MLEPPASDGLVLVAQPLTGQPFRVTDTGLVVTGAPSFEEWEHVGERLAALERGLQWAIGDWLNYGSCKYARGRYETVAASLGLEKETVRKYAQVAAAYESGIRIPSLTFLHHQLAAALPAQQRQALLLEAGRRGWSASRLKSPFSPFPVLVEREKRRAGPCQSRQSGYQADSCNFVR